MESNYNKKTYLKSVGELILSILAFAVYGSIIALLSFNPIIPIIKIPLLLVNFSMFVYSDCRRIDKWNTYKTLREAKKNYENSIEQEEEKMEIENNKMQKNNLVSKIKNNKPETLPLPNDKEKIENDKVEEKDDFDIVSPEEPYPSIFKIISNLIKKRKSTSQEKLFLPKEDNNIENSTKLKPKKTSKIVSGIKNIFNKKEKAEILPLPLEAEEEKQVEKPIINYSFTKNGPQITEIDLSNIHTEPGLYIEPQYFGFENDPADVKHIIVNKNDEEVNNYVAEEIEHATGMEPIYNDYTVEDKEKRVYVLTR